jgi:DNA-binding NtrC family response regulator
MKEKILIAEDEFIVANELQMALEEAGYIVCGIAASVAEAREIIRKEKPSLALLDIHLEGKLDGIQLAKELKENNIGFVYLSANSNQQTLEAAKATEPYGFLVKPYREKDLLITLDIARYRQEHGFESRIRRENNLHDQLNAFIQEHTDWETRFLRMARAMQAYIPFDYIVVLSNADEQLNNYISLLRIGFDEYQLIKKEELLTITGLNADSLGQIRAKSPDSGHAAWYNGPDFEKVCRHNPLKKQIADTFQLASNLVLPVLRPGGELYFFFFFDHRDNAYNQEHLYLLFHQQQLLNIALDRASESLPKNTGGIEAMEKRGKAGLTAVEPLRTSGFQGVIGKSPALLNVLDAVALVASVDTSVLILGESGTGKERIADCIHQNSRRKSKPFVKVNCAAMPGTLIESELFGHEKGAFTGALERRLGKFELAEGGTIFLDEIGDMPIEMQVKFLRVLQEKEIERIGGRQSVKIDVRIVAATNKNLEKEVSEGRFRLDLYYRLNVFPITLPALRDRKEDLPELAHFFASRYCKRFNKSFPGFNPGMMQELAAYDWPGNIRELENVIEQSVVINDGQSALTLGRRLASANFIPAGARNINTDASVQSMTDLKNIHKQTEIDYLRSVLQKTRGRIRGKGGAAEILNQKPTTLESQMAKLGIRKEDFF